MSIASAILRRVLENTSEFGDAGGLMRKCPVRCGYVHDEIGEIRAIYISNRKYMISSG